MGLSVDRVISTLNELIETCKDGEQGFQIAAENIQDRELEGLLRSYARQRGEFATELQSLVARLGGDPERRGSVAGAMHRGWINIRAVVQGHKPEDILAECERGEDVAVATYGEALAKDLPDECRALVARQYARIQETHARVRVLEKSNLKYRMDKPSFNT